jgi:hypothetical protein
MRPAIQQEAPPLPVPCTAHAGKTIEKLSHKTKTCLKPERRKKEVVTLVKMRKEQCAEAHNRHVQQQASQLPPSLGGMAMEFVVEPEKVILEEYYWQVFENSVKDVMDIFL